jgi:hypothetical protein
LQIVTGDDEVDGFHVFDPVVFRAASFAFTDGGFATAT